MNIFLYIIVDSEHLKHAFHNKFAILCGISLQFIILPFLGFCAVKLFLNNDDVVAFTLLVVTSSPGGSYSNWWCSLFNADLGLSVTMTAISTVLSAVMLPVNLILYTRLLIIADDDNNDEHDPSTASTSSASILQSIDWRSLFTALAVVIVAIGCGLCFSFYSEFSTMKNRLIVNRLGMLSGIALITFGFIASNFTDNNENSNSNNNSSPKLWDKDLFFYIGVAFPCVVSIVIASILASVAKLTKPERVTVAVECSYQNPGIATSVAIAMFADDSSKRALAMGVPLYYGFIEAVVCGLYCILCWKIGWTKAPKDENMWTVMLKSYEVSSNNNETNNDNNEDDEDIESKPNNNKNSSIIILNSEEEGNNNDDDDNDNFDSNACNDLSCTARDRLFTTDSTYTAVTHRTERLCSTDSSYLSNRSR